MLYSHRKYARLYCSYMRLHVATRLRTWEHSSVIESLNDMLYALVICSQLRPAHSAAAQAPAVSTDAQRSSDSTDPPARRSAEPPAREGSIEHSADSTHGNWYIALHIKPVPAFSTKQAHPALVLQVQTVTLARRLSLLNCDGQTLDFGCVAVGGSGSAVLQLQYDAKGTYDRRCIRCYHYVLCYLANELVAQL